MRPSNKNQAHERISRCDDIHTNSATGSTILSTLLTKSDYRGTIGIALTINTSLAKEKISLKSLAITYHTKPAPKCMQITICKITMPRLSRRLS